MNIDGLVVDWVVRDDVGQRVWHCSTDPQLAGWCPACGEQSTAPKAWVTTRPRDVLIGEDRPILLWRSSDEGLVMAQHGRVKRRAELPNREHADKPVDAPTITSTGSNKP